MALPLAEAAAAVFVALLLPDAALMFVATPLLVVDANDEVDVGATIKVVVPYTDAAAQYCVWYCCTDVTPGSLGQFA